MSKNIQSHCVTGLNSKLCLLFSNSTLPQSMDFGKTVEKHKHGTPQPSWILRGGAAWMRGVVKKKRNQSKKKKKKFLEPKFYPLHL